MELTLGKSAYIKLKNESTQKEITLEQVKDLLKKYISNMKKSGEQTEWDYESFSFPYTIEEKTEGAIKYLYLKAADPLYNYLVIGVGKVETDNDSEHFIQIVLPDEDYRTPGDVAKGNEFAKYFAVTLKAELHMFNERVIYYNPRK